MLALRSRTKPLIVSNILFVSFFFVTIQSGEGLKCYTCVSEPGGNCTTLENIQSVECKPSFIASTTSTTTTTTTTTTTQKPPSEKTFSGEAESLFEFIQPDVYANEVKYACFHGSITVRWNNTDMSAVGRGCAPINGDISLSFQPDVMLKSFEYNACDSNNCNSSDGIQIGVISLFLPLIASLLATR